MICESAFPYIFASCLSAAKGRIKKTYGFIHIRMGEERVKIHILKNYAFKIHYRPPFLPYYHQHPSLATSTNHSCQPPLTPTATSHHRQPTLKPPTTSIHHCHHPPSIFLFFPFWGVGRFRPKYGQIHMFFNPSLKLLFFVQIFFLIVLHFTCLNTAERIILFLKLMLHPF